MQTLSITNILLIGSGVDDWSLNIMWIVCDVMSGAVVWIPGIWISLRRTCVCEISLWMCVS